MISYDIYIYSSCFTSGHLFQEDRYYPAFLKNSLDSLYALLLILTGKQSITKELPAPYDFPRPMFNLPTSPAQLSFTIQR